MQALARKYQEPNPIILPPGTPGAMSIKEAAEWCGIGIQTAYKLARRGEWPAIKIGEGQNGRVIVPTLSLAEWLRDSIGTTIDTEYEPIAPREPQTHAGQHSKRKGTYT